MVDQELSGFGAVKQVKSGKQYKLIITDLSMPMIDGYQLAEQIRDYSKLMNLPQPMIIACTGHTEPEYI